MVEAAVVFPLVILIVLGIISIALAKYTDVQGSAERHREDALGWFDDSAPHAEDVLRARWLLDEDKTE